MVRSGHDKNWIPPVIKAVAITGEGVKELLEKAEEHFKIRSDEKQIFLLTEKAFHLIQNKRMKHIDKKELMKNLNGLIKQPSFNLYSFIAAYYQA